jgi:xylulokinase
MKDLLIGCDIGTSSTKAVVVTEQGKVLAYATVSYGLIQKHNGWAEQNPSVLVQACLSAIREVVARIDSTRIAGMCISALYGGTGVICDDQYKVVRPSIIWMDTRSEDESKQVEQAIGTGAMYGVTMNGIDPYFGYIKLLWIKKHEPENWKRIKHILPIHSYLVYLLTGINTIDFSSYGNFGGIFDMKTHTLSIDMCERLGIDSSWFSTNISNPEDIAGSLTLTYQESLGLSSAVPVCFGTVDCIASMLSAGIVAEGDNAAVLGTSLNWGLIHNEAYGNANLVSMPYCVEPKKLIYTYGGSTTAGALPRWFMQKFLKDESAGEYSILEKKILSDKIPVGSDGLTVLPYFMGERTPIWDADATGVFFGLSLHHDERYIFHAILESVAFSLKDIITSMGKDSSCIKKITLVGGGAKSKLWKQIIADVVGVPIITPINTAEAPLGDAFIAGKGVGLTPGYEGIKKWVEFEDPIIPDLKNTELYVKYFSIYKQLYEDLKGLMKKRKELLKN